jgi:3-oxoacyl-[acyl-carrier protein] reductase
MIKTAIVTGGSQGIGKGIVECFIEKGYNVMITGRDEVSLLQCVNDMQNIINRNGTLNKISYIVSDVSIKKSCEDMILQCTNQYGQLDVLVCNAGIYPEATVETVTEEIINETMRINYNGTVFCIQSSIPMLKKSNNPRIIIISSITGPITGNIGFAHYAASKAAQIGFMKTAAMELAPYKITVNAILPG